jgi:hypothetical protein
MAVVAIAALAAGTVMNTVGAIKQGEAAERAGRYNAAISNNNALIAERQGEADAAAQRIDARKHIGQIRANAAASGLGTDGSVMDVLEESVANAEYDNMMIKHNAALRAYGFRNDATLALQEGQAKKEAAGWAAAGAAFGGIGQIAGVASNMKSGSKSGKVLGGDT